MFRSADFCETHEIHTTECTQNKRNYLVNAGAIRKINIKLSRIVRLLSGMFKSREDFKVSRKVSRWILLRWTFR